MDFANGYTMAMAYNIDPLGILYGCLAATWSIVLLLGSIYLLLNRTQQCIRIRNIALALSAVAILHIYWILCLLAYMLQGYFPCGVEFWIMSVYLPLGISLFHAANTQLLQVAGLQKQYLHPNTSASGQLKRSDKPQTRHQRASIFHCKDKVKRTISYISCFMVLQLMVTLFVFFISRKFHPAFGLIAPSFEPQYDGSAGCLQDQGQPPSASCDTAQKFACRRGWEWIPSILWQIFWSWIYAPYLLWNLRGVKDIHGWRTQTAICCFAGLPASPMWLAALYIPQMKNINRYYIPPMWFAPSICLIEAVIVFVPCWNILKSKKLERNTEAIIEEWQNKRHGSMTSLGDGSTLVEAASSHQGSTISTPSICRGQMYTMEALETTLRQNHQPLLQFASLRDFSGENISFLVYVMNWKLDWEPASPTRSGYIRKSRMKALQGDNLRRYQFEQALDIYVSFISLKYSNYAINLSSPQYKQLEDIFEGAASVIHGPLHSHVDAVTPFNDFWNTPLAATSSNIEKESSKDAVSTTSTIAPPGYNQSNDNSLPASFDPTSAMQTHEVIQIGQKLPEYVPVPVAFSPAVFNTAEESIKYMVLTNTWVKFVKESQSKNNKKNLIHNLRCALA